MPSSTSSSETQLHIPARHVPAGRWALPWIVAVVVVAGGVFGLEAVARSHGFKPSVTDDRFLWAWERGRVSDGEARTLAVLGSSRIQVAWRPAVARELLPRWTIGLLGLNGTAPLATLQDLADDDEFRGVAIVDMASGHFSARAWRHQRKQLATYHRRWMTPGAMAERWLTTQVQSRLALFTAGGRGTLDSLLTSGRLRDAAGVTTSPERAQWVEFSPRKAAQARARRIRRIPAATVRFKSPAHWLAETRKVEPFIDAIQARGGKVVYLRMPTCDELLAADEDANPKATYWDALARQTHAAATVHFRDYPSLAGFKCPDTSHIAAKDGDAFTRALLDILIERGVLVP